RRPLRATARRARGRTGDAHLPGLRPRARRTQVQALLPAPRLRLLPLLRRLLLSGRPVHDAGPDQFRVPPESKPSRKIRFETTRTTARVAERAGSVSAKPSPATGTVPAGPSRVAGVKRQSAAGPATGTATSTSTSRGEVSLLNSST